MERNISENGLEKIIEPMNMGCSSRIQATTAVSSESGALWTFINDDDDSVQVKPTTINEFVFPRNLKNIDFIKLDVEGFESEVLLGAKEVLQYFHPGLAVALYHKSRGLLTIPNLINELAEYKLFVRSNMDSPYGLNLFCV